MYRPVRRLVRMKTLQVEVSKLIEAQSESSNNFEHRASYECFQEITKTTAGSILVYAN